MIAAERPAGCVKKGQQEVEFRPAKRDAGCIGTRQVVTGDIECEPGETDAVCLSNGGLEILSAVSTNVRRHRRASFFELSHLASRRRSLSTTWRRWFELKRFWSGSEIDFY